MSWMLRFPLGDACCLRSVMLPLRLQLTLPTHTHLDLSSTRCSLNHSISMVQFVSSVCCLRSPAGLASTPLSMTACPQGLLDNPSRFHALVLSPTRELALQIKEQIEALGAGIAVKCAALVGGIDMVSQVLSGFPLFCFVAVDAGAPRPDHALEL